MWLIRRSNFILAFAEKNQRTFSNEKELDQSDSGNPHLGLLSPEMLAVLPGISMPKVEEDIIASSISDILLNLWRLSETRKRLSKKEPTELNWLCELEASYKQELTKSLATLRSEAPEALTYKYEGIIESITENDTPFTSETFQQLFIEDIQSRVR